MALLEQAPRMVEALPWHAAWRLGPAPRGTESDVALVLAPAPPAGTAVPNNQHAELALTLRSEHFPYWSRSRPPMLGNTHFIAQYHAV